MADRSIGGVVSGGITVLCRHIHITAHGKGDGLCLAVLTCEQGEIAGGRPTVKHFAIVHCVLVQRHGHCCVVRYRVGLFAGGLVSSNSQGIGHILVTVFHGNNAAGHGQRVADCGIVGVVSGGITVLCRHIHITVHGKGDVFCRVVLTCGQGRPAVKHIALRNQVLVQRHGHFCAFRYIVGLFVAGHDRDNVQRLAAFFHGSSAAGYGQRVVDRSPTGIEGDVLRNCGFVHIKELAIFGLAIFGVPAGEVVTRTGGSFDGSQIVCIDFFGLINRHLRVVGLVAAIGIKGHLAEVKEIAVFQFIIGINVRIVIIVCKQSICGGLVVFVVDGTIGVPSRTSSQTVFERSQSSREYNVFQFGAFFKGTRFNGCYIFRDGDVRQSRATSKGPTADRLNILTERNRFKFRALIKGFFADGSDAIWNGDLRQ